MAFASTGGSCMSASSFSRMFGSDPGVWKHEDRLRSAYYGPFRTFGTSCLLYILGRLTDQVEKSVKKKTVFEEK
jgi:hypothetical protein